MRVCVCTCILARMCLCVYTCLCLSACFLSCARVRVRVRVCVCCVNVCGYLYSLLCVASLLHPRLSSRMVHVLASLRAVCARVCACVCVSVCFCVRVRVMCVSLITDSTHTTTARERLPPSHTRPTDCCSAHTSHSTGCAVPPAPSLLPRDHAPARPSHRLVGEP